HERTARPDAPPTHPAPPAQARPPAAEWSLPPQPPITPTEPRTDPLRPRDHRTPARQRSTDPHDRILLGHGRPDSVWMTHSGRDAGEARPVPSGNPIEPGGPADGGHDRGLGDRRPVRSGGGTCTEVLGPGVVRLLTVGRGGAAPRSIRETFAAASPDD